MACLEIQPFSEIVPSDIANFLLISELQEPPICLGLDTTGGVVTIASEVNWLQNWDSGNCNTFLDRVPFGMSQSMMTFLLTRYYSNHNFTLDKYSISTIENNMLNVCSAYPGSCMNIETTMCKNCNNQEISESYGLNRFCGCFSATAPVQGFSRECQPLCSIGTAIKLTDDKGVSLECEEAVCVIDNISIQASNTSFNNSSISQICGYCATSGGCKCFIDSSLPNLAFQLGISGSGDTFKTYCTDAQCFTIDQETQVTTEVSCQSFNRSVSTVNEIYISKSVWVIFCIIIFFGILVVLCLYLWGESFKLYSWNIWKPQPVNTTGMTSQTFSE